MLAGYRWPEVGERERSTLFANKRARIGAPAQNPAISLVVPIEDLLQRSGNGIHGPAENGEMYPAASLTGPRDDN